MDEPKQLFLILIVSASLLFAVESFIPGGILGLFGIIALIAAMITGYSAFPGYGPVVAISIAVSAIVLFVIWLKVLPKTWITKALTVKKDLGDAYGTNDSLENLMDKTGVTLCQLHPSGFAAIDGKKVDVITQGEMLEKDVGIKVIDVESNRVVVKKI